MVADDSWRRIMRGFGGIGVWLLGPGGRAVLLVLVLVLGMSGPVEAQGFEDDNWRNYESAFDALAAEGILDGTECGEDLICPEEEIKRWVVAVWLVRALEGGEPAAEGLPRFEDVDAEEWWAPYVERLAELKVTKGCAVEPKRFCPDEPVTREHMAAFLSRAFSLEPAAEVGFVDLQDSRFQSHINALAAAKITQGCAVNPARFCPEALVTRGQMATFLARALGLVRLPPAVDAPGRITSHDLEYSSEIVVVNADGSGRQILVKGRDPAWSPDGARVAFVSRHDELFVMDASGENIRVIGGLLASNPVWEDFGPVWSPDSSRLAYIDKSSAAHLGQVSVVDVDTGKARRITYNPYQGADPVWSPDGERIAFAGGMGNEWYLYVVDEDGSAQKQLTTHRSYPFMRDLAWSPHGDHIAFTSPGKDGRDAEVFVVEADSGLVRQLTDNVHAQDWEPEWSPDGTRIVYAADSRDGRREIFVMDADGDNVRRLTHRSGGREEWLNNAWPVWSPDGARIAFNSNDTNRNWAIFVMDADGGNLLQLTDSPYIARWPVWLPDSSRIAFTRERR